MSWGLVRRGLQPSFLWRPDILLRAVWRKTRPRPAHCVVRTAWGDLLGVDPRRFIGGNVYMTGVHELPVCEALWRLTCPAETVADVGANIGVMTSLLSRRVGPAGRVLAFEPHPRLFRELKRNVQRWPNRRVECLQRAASSEGGIRWLQEEVWFGRNEGTARLRDEPRDKSSLEVISLRLDQVLSTEACRVIKIDVESHETEAIAGASGLLQTATVRDLVFESTWDYPNPAHRLLTAYGYTIFDLGATLRGPALTIPSARRGPSGRIRDYLATRAADRAQRLMESPGWQTLWSR